MLFTEKSIKKSLWAGSAAKFYTGPSLERYEQLNFFLSHLNLIDIFLLQKNEVSKNFIFGTDQKIKENLKIKKLLEDFPENLM
jgi:hypothetical protein